MRMPVAAQRASMPVALVDGECAGEDFSAVMVRALTKTAMVCHLFHLTTSRAASEAHSAVPCRLACSTFHGGRPRQSPGVHRAFAPAGCSPRPREILFARPSRRGGRDG